MSFGWFKSDKSHEARLEEAEQRFQEKLKKLRCKKMSSKMYITKQEVEKILEVMNEFDTAKSYLLEDDNSSGIGSILTLTMDMDINNRAAKVKVDITGVETW